MKRILIITIAVIATTITLCSATSSMSSNTSNGTLRFESTTMPALNCTLPMSRVTAIYRLLPESLTNLCFSEYQTVRDKLNHSSTFTHEGVRVRMTGEDPMMTIIFTIQGYKLTVTDVSWNDIDSVFNGSIANN